MFPNVITLKKGSFWPRFDMDSNIMCINETIQRLIQHDIIRLINKNTIILTFLWYLQYGEGFDSAGRFKLSSRFPWFKMVPCCKFICDCKLAISPLISFTNELISPNGIYGRTFFIFKFSYSHVYIHVNMCNMWIKSHIALYKWWILKKKVWIIPKYVIFFNDIRIFTIIIWHEHLSVT